MDGVLVSCIITFLNTEKFLAEAIDSILAQSYDHWELLLVDDGSTDDSTVIAREYVRQYPQKMRYLEHEGHQNKGISASRNLGIRFAKGKYVAFLDADDIWLPHKLERQVEILDARPEAGMVYGSLYYWYSWTGDPNDRQRDYIGEVWNYPSLTMLTWPEYLPLFVREQILVPSPTCIMARREVIQQIGGFEDDFRNLFEDQVFVAKMSLAAPIVLLKEYLEKWRRHEGSSTYLSEKVAGEEQRMRSVYLTWLKKYLAQIGVKDTRLRLVVIKALLPYRYPHLFAFYQRLKGFQQRFSN
ncbi:MAG: glycosyltransferase family A protein [Saprospiraceae bacterium]|nr:glycosyltransferase family 2 protein [Lewinella sp.]